MAAACVPARSSSPPLPLPLALPRPFVLFVLLLVSLSHSFRIQVFSGLEHSFVPDSAATLGDSPPPPRRAYHYFTPDHNFFDCYSFAERTARWNTTGQGAASEGGPPGLDGGIEYFVRPSLCRGIQGDALRGRAGRTVTCEDLEQAVGRALETWSLRHQSLYFRRVYDEGRAELLIGSEEHHEASLSKAGRAGHKHRETEAIAYAQLGLDTDPARAANPVRSTAGFVVPGFAIKHAWIRFNPDHCFYIKVSGMCLDDRPRLRFYAGYTVAIAAAALLGGAGLCRAYGKCSRYPSRRQEQALALSIKLAVAAIALAAGMGAWMRSCGASIGCFNFETILRHEVGHVLGVDHPDPEGVHNLDTDLRDGNHVPIDELDPCRGLRLNPERYWKSIMVSHGQRTTRRHKLAHDDVAALHFLYPVDARWRITSRDPVPFRWMPTDKLVALAVSQGLKAAEDDDATPLQTWEAGARGGDGTGGGGGDGGGGGGGRGGGGSGGDDDEKQLRKSLLSALESTKAKRWFRRKQQEEDDYDTAEEEDEMEMAVLQEVLAASGAAGRGGASDGDKGEL